MAITQHERYKLMFAEHHYASDWREKIVRGYCLMLAGLAVVFAWIQHTAQPLSWVVSAVALVATLIMWIGDARNRAGIHGAKKVGAAIEKNATAGIPTDERFFTALQATTWYERVLTHSRTIDLFALLALAAFLFATFYLWRNGGVLPGPVSLAKSP